MSFRDKSVKCFNCGTTFTCSAGERESFQSKGFTNELKRCPSCHRAKKHNVPTVVATATVPSGK